MWACFLSHVGGPNKMLRRKRSKQVIAICERNLWWETELGKFDFSKSNFTNQFEISHFLKCVFLNILKQWFLIWFYLYFGIYFQNIFVASTLWKFDRFLLLCFFFEKQFYLFTHFSNWFEPTITYHDTMGLNVCFIAWRKICFVMIMLYSKII